MQRSVPAIGPTCVRQCQPGLWTIRPTTKSSMSNSSFCPSSYGRTSSGEVTGLCWRRGMSAPPQRWCDVGQETLQDVGVVVDAQLVRDGQQQRVRCGYCGVGPEQVHHGVRLGGVGAAKDGARRLVEVADRVDVLG